MCLILRDVPLGKYPSRPQGCVMPMDQTRVHIQNQTRLHYIPIAFQCVYGCNDGKDGRKWRLPGPVYADGLVLCGESE